MEAQIENLKPRVGEPTKQLPPEQATAFDAQASLRLTRRDDDVALVEWDMAGQKVNKLSRPMLQRFAEVCEELAAGSYKAAVFISRKKNIFIAGADIGEIQAHQKSERGQDGFKEVINSAHRILNLFEDLPIPTIAAIEGACLGGGLEWALACDYRLASDVPSTRIGLPEVKLGLLPGFGGCWRLPRLIGLPPALDIILAGRAVDAKKAYRLGLVDECVPTEVLEQRALEFARTVNKKRKPRPRNKSFMFRFLNSPLGRGLVFKQARKTVMQQTKGFYPAPLKALGAVQQTYGLRDRNRALAIETQAFCQVSTTEVSRHLIDLFYLTEGVKKQNGTLNKEAGRQPVQQVGVLGAGVMGGGVAYVVADKGIAVRLKDISNQALAVGFAAARALWDKKLKRRRLTSHALQQKMSLVTGSTTWSGMKQADVVVEAVVEDMGVKKKVLSELAQHIKPECVVATNTSSLSVNAMAASYPRPENFVGLHFFNPVDKMPLVEVIRGERSSDEAVATVFNLAKKLGKTPVVVQDGPGFLVNRLLLPYLAESLFLLEGGMAVDQLDRYYTHKFGLPMGPLRLFDEIGHDTGIKVLHIFRQALGERVQISKLAEKIASWPRRGKKNGRGFYLYKGREVKPDESVYAELGLSAPKSDLSPEECVERGVFQMINEAATVLLNEKIVASPQELDLAMIFGMGFPPFRGGLLRYADEVGAQRVVEHLTAYADKYGVRFQPQPALRELAQREGRFYV